MKDIMQQIISCERNEEVYFEFSAHMLIIHRMRT